MKTKAEASSPEKSARKSGKATIKNAVAVVRPKPSEEEVRELAEIIYNQRIDRGEYGTPESDWLTAESYLSSV